MTQKLSSPKTSFLNWLKHFQAQFCSGHQVQPSHYGLYRLWRIWFVTQRTTNAESGFILPTVTLLLLMVSLIIGLLVSRTYSRTTEVAGDRRQTVLYNSVTPAIDRAKAKLEYLFTEASLPPLPSDLDLRTELSDTKYNLSSQNNASKETRMDVNGDRTLDNAWIYTTDLDGDGETETVAYSILSNAVAVDDDVTYNLESTVNKNKAQALVVRNGPINLHTSDASTCANAQTSPYAGWESVDSSELRKALQVHAVVLEDTNSDNPISATLEMQQDRVANLGNRWAAWFRYDLGANPDAGFRMNGAIHTEGNFFLTSDMVAYLVSSPDSCVYSASASEISMAQIDKAKGNQQRFQGQLLNSISYDNNPSGQIFVDRFTSSGPTGDLKTNASVISEKANDRIKITAENSTGSLIRKNSTTSTSTTSQLRLNPIALFTQGISESMGSDRTNFSYRATDWKEDNKLAVGPGDGGRIFNNTTPIPFLDDTYRADDRWGPKPLYTDTLVVPDGSLGNTIPSGTLELLQNDPLVSTQPDEEAFGFDGYWERRARRAGVRLIVGQRLELGNASEWLYEDLDSDGVLDSGEDTNGNGYLDVDPLYPPRLNAYAGTNMAKRGHEMRQWKTLRDNLAAVQATAVYHYKQSYDYPVACLATTAHPGTQVTDTNSRTFNYLETTGDTTGDFISTDFYTGKGTNGIEFAAPFAGNAATFETQINNNSSALRIALTNLAYFAGDGDLDSDSVLEINGAFPPTQDAHTGVMHPYPRSTMWGNFSELRRVIGLLDSGTTYSNLSPADKTTLHTATCTIGMLAYATDVKKAQFTQTSSTLSNSGLNSFMVDVQKLLDGAGSPNYNSTQNKWTGSSEMWELVSANDTYNPTTGYVTCESDPSKVVERDLADNDLNTPGNSNFIAFPKSQLPTYSGTNKYDPNLWTNSEFKTYFANFHLGHWICAQYRSVSGNNINQATITSNFNQIKSLITNIQLSLFQIERDRALGFREGSFDFKSSNPVSGAIPWDPVTGEVTYNGFGSASTTVQLPVGCNPTAVKNLLGGSGVGLNDQSISMALAICSTTVSKAFPIRYPSVYYIFPVAAHSHDGAFPPNTVALNGGSGTNSVITNAGTANIPQAMQTGGGSAVRDNEYANDPYLYNSTGSGINYYRDGTSRRFFYRPVEDALSASPDGVVQSATESLSSFVTYLGVTPRTSASAWATPVVADTDLTQNAGRSNAILFDTNKTIASGATEGAPDVFYYPAFLDMGIYNGRELMSVRTLSIDLDLLRQTRLNNESGGCTYDDPESMAEYNADNNGKCWLPLPTLVEKNGGTTTTNAIIYAFREDAVREDAIARPTRPDASNLTCAANFTQWTTQFRNHVNRDRNNDGVTSEVDSNNNGIMNEYDPTNNVSSSLDITDMLMDATGVTGGYYDPPVNPCTKISPKPVDFYNDPDRRPHGFVLRNGKDLRRKRTSETNSFTGTAYDYSPRGMSFISDQPVYIWGDFNYHSDERTTDAAVNDVQEFTTPLADDWSNFYSRTTLNNDFVDYGDVDKDNRIDTWRPVEILADATTILSNGFNPGFIEDGLLWNWQGSDSTRSNQTTSTIAGERDSTRNSYGNIRVLRTIEKPPQNTSADNSLQADTKDNDDNSISPAQRVNPSLWVREDGTITATLPGTITATLPGHSPIKLDRNGFPIYRRYEDPDTSPTDTSYDLTYYTDVDLLGDTNSTPDPNVFVDVAYGTNSLNAIEKTLELFESPTFDNSQYGARRRIQTGINTTINAVVVSAVSPLRITHSNGGLHNFLRLTETWGSGDIDDNGRGTVTDLNFRGSLIQLNFSVYSGVQTHNELEPGQPVGSNGATIYYYHEADRLWGYDPALLYAPAAPAARRFASPGKTRSEFYRELATDDPYILNLRCASYDSDGDGKLDKKVDPSASCQ